jgi:hypothetical protein
LKDGEPGERSGHFAPIISIVGKAILLSVLFGMIAIPVLVARDANPRRGFQKVMLLTLVFNLLYLLAVRFIYPRLQ